MDKSFIMNKLKQNYDIIENMGYEVVGVFLQGSQNYGLEYEDSDVDCVAIVLPTMKNVILLEKNISFTHVLETNEHIDVKDIRLIINYFKRQNIKYMEILFTDYYLLNEKYSSLFNTLIKRREEITRYNNYAIVNCISGIALEKYKAMEHPYPTLLEKIKKYKYDPKQLHHILRLEEFLYRYSNSTTFIDALISLKREYLIDVKRGIHSLEEARELANTSTSSMVQFKNEYMLKNKPVIDKNIEIIWNDVLVKLIMCGFKNELEV